MPSHPAAKELEQAVALAEQVVVTGGAALDPSDLPTNSAFPHPDVRPAE